MSVFNHRVHDPDPIIRPISPDASQTMPAGCSSPSVQEPSAASVSGSSPSGLTDDSPAASSSSKSNPCLPGGSLWKQSATMCIPVIASYLFVGFAYGLVMQAAGFGWFWPLVSSLFLYTGAFQFVLCALVSGGTSLAAILISGLLLNSRQSFYALTFVPDFNDMPSVKPFMIHTLTDETYALGCTLLDHPCRKELMLRNHLICWLTWSFASLAGALAGEWIPLPTDGLDFCLTALFVTIFISQWKSTTHHAPALAGLTIGILCLLVFGPDRFMLPALLLVSGFLLLEPRMQPSHSHATTKKEACPLNPQEENT